MNKSFMFHIQVYPLVFLAGIRSENFTPVVVVLAAAPTAAVVAVLLVLPLLLSILLLPVVVLHAVVVVRSDGGGGGIVARLGSFRSASVGSRISALSLVMNSFFANYWVDTYIYGKL